jgi:hypothetical protein
VVGEGDYGHAARCLARRLERRATFSNSDQTVPGDSDW